jgi:hypothetical protein
VVVKSGEKRMEGGEGSGRQPPAGLGLRAWYGAVRGPPARRRPRFQAAIRQWYGMGLHVTAAILDRSASTKNVFRTSVSSSTKAG